MGQLIHCNLSTGIYSLKGGNKMDNNKEKDGFVINHNDTAQLEQMMPRKNIIHITHNDADAIGCDVVARLAYDGIMDTHFCSAAGADNVVNKVIYYVGQLILTNPDCVPSKILITDVSVSDNTARRLEQFNNNGIEILLVDHHKSNCLSKDYDWCVIEPDLNKSAAMLLFEICKDYIEPRFVNVVEEFVTKVSRYDTWEWKKTPSTLMDEEYTSILTHMMYLPQLSSSICNRIKKNGTTFGHDDKLLIDAYIILRKKALDNIKFKIIELEHGGKFAFTLLQDMFVNEVMECLYTNNDVDFVLGVHPETRMASLRTNKDDIDVQQLALNLFEKSGGHKKAAGGIISIQLLLNLLSMYYTEDGVECFE